MPTSGAEELFARFVDEGRDLVAVAVEEGWGENQILEFKQAQNNTGPMAVDDRKNLGEALSGFANADGGVIVWGVRANTEEVGEPDVAKDLRPISNLRRFVSDLEGLSGQLASPAVAGVLHQAIPESAGNLDKGYAITFVPRSDGLPPMAVAKDQHRYYMRAGASFIKMTSSMVADRHLRRPQPKLEFFYRVCERRPAIQPPHEIKKRFIAIIIVGIKNTGRGIARFPALRIHRTPTFSPSLYGLDGNGGDGLTRTASERGPNATAYYAGGSDQVIYPGTEHPVTVFEALFERDEPTPDLPVRFAIHCDGDSEEGEVIVPAAELDAAKQR